MIRAVLVGWSDTDWKLYRQSRWMAEVRRTPEASSLPRRHFDIEESAFSGALEAWKRDEGGSDLEAALDLLRRLGALEITPS
jgi:hypothetical protein